MSYQIKLNIVVHANSLMQALAKVTNALDEIADCDILGHQEISEEGEDEDEQEQPTTISWEYNNYPGFNL